MSEMIQSIQKSDLAKIAAIIREHWGGETIVAHGVLFHPGTLAGIKAVKENEIIGFLHYQIRGEECEILTLISLQEDQGIGSTLIAEVESIARVNHCQRLSLITTNDNLHALGFYQRRGFRLAALFPGQMDISRKLKPSIPLIGEHHIPLRDELRLEKDLR